MRTKQINLAVILLALSMLSLLIVQSFQLYSKYYQKKKELSSEIIAFQNQIAYKHEKAEDYRRYMQIINQDFSLQYQDILKSEFQSQVWTKSNYYWLLLGYSLLVFLVFLMLFLFLKHYRPIIYENNTKVTFIFFNISPSFQYVNGFRYYRFQYLGHNFRV